MSSHIIHVRNVNEAFYEGWWWLKTSGIKEQSRNGPVLVAQGTVLTEYTHPMERVLFNPDRDANPVFHLMECVWMLAGHRNVDWLKQFNANIATYAENDGVMHGAYGERWFYHFGIDQISRIIEILKKDPESRQAVLQMWDPLYDLFGSWKDRPCNSQVYFDCRGGQLNMTVCCRSNDMLWGAYGANAVHFSFLQEAMAHELVVPVGIYRQFSNNFHVYTDNDMVKKFMEKPPFEAYNLYKDGASPYPILSLPETLFDLRMDCEYLITEQYNKLRTIFMKDIAGPLCAAYLLRKQKLPYDVSGIPFCDWKLAFEAWTQRRDNRERQ